MNIYTSQGILHSNNAVLVNQNKTNNRTLLKNMAVDTFNQKENIQKQVSFSGLTLFNFLYDILKPNNSDLDKEKDKTLSFGEILSIGVQQEWENEYIPPENFKSIMTPLQLTLFLKELKKDNFISTLKNQEDGIYNTDMDYMSSFSYNGRESVSDILDSAAKYANAYFEKTGKNFVFALTDNDNIEGVKYAVRHIGENPDKFKHLSFIPGVKMSFAYRVADTRCENSRVLVYGINPFSPNLNSYVDNTIEKRKNMVYEFIKNAAELYKEAHFNGEEFYSHNRINFSKDMGQPNLYWRVREYITSKSDADILGLALTPEEIYNFSEDIFSGMDTLYTGSEDFEKLCTQISDNGEDANLLIKKLFDRFSTRYDPETQEIASDSENVYLNFVNCIKQEPHRPIMALSAPYYFSHHFEKPGAKEFPNVVAFIERLRKDSDGMLVAFETVAPIYDLDKRLPQLDIDMFNDYVKENTGLKEVGGSFATIEAEFLPGVD